MVNEEGEDIKHMKIFTRWDGVDQPRLKLPVDMTQKNGGHGDEDRQHMKFIVQISHLYTDKVAKGERLKESMLNFHAIGN